VTTVTVVGEPSSVTDEWDELADRTQAPPWLRPGWVLAWQRAFMGDRGRLELLCIKDGPRMQAALPLVRTGATVATPANSETPSFGALAETGDGLARMGDHLFARGDRRVTLWPFEARGDIEVLLSAARGHGYSPVARTIGRSPFIPLEGGWDEYRATLGSKLLSEARRRRRRLESQGTVTFGVEDGTADLGARVAEAFAVEAAGWKGRSGTAIATRDAARAFYEEVCAWAARRGTLRLAFLRLDGRPVAFDLSLEEGGAHYLLKTSYDPEFSAYGPGVLIRHEMIQRAFAAGLDRYELLGHDEPWKHQWAHHFHERVLVRLFAPTRAGAADRFLHARVRPAVRRGLERVRNARR
jgi:CelD/BcsL family acetyltransferase involved in cellulose biosynthesis